MSEVHFIVEETPEGGFVACAMGADILTEADSIEVLHMRVRDAVHCHFDPQQMPSHIRPRSHARGEHHLTIPNHDPLRIGTLASILDGVATHHGMTGDALLQQLLE